MNKDMTRLYFNLAELDPGEVCKLNCLMHVFLRESKPPTKGP